jgi:hypothetical protein
LCCSDAFWKKTYFYLIDLHQIVCGLLLCVGREGGAQKMGRKPLKWPSEPVIALWDESRLSKQVSG